MNRWIYCDVDGTLTEAPESRWGKPRLDVIGRIKDAIGEGDVVVLWSGAGAEYAEAFAERYGIKARACLSKPDLLIDDVPSLRPRGITVLLPGEVGRLL